MKPHKPLRPFKTKCNCLILPNGIYLSSSYIYYNLYFVTINNSFYKSININSKIERSFVLLKPSAIEASCIPFQVLSWTCSKSVDPGIRGPKPVPNRSQNRRRTRPGPSKIWNFEPDRRKISKPGIEPQLRKNSKSLTGPVKFSDQSVPGLAIRGSLGGPRWLDQRY